MSYIIDYIENNKQRFQDELFGLIRIPSISALPANKPQMYEATRYWQKTLLDAGADKAEIYETAGNPVVYGEKIVDKTKPTVLVYGHYDVMPVDPLDLWKSHPFEPQIRDGKIFARGADDDKGQCFIQAKAFELLCATGNLPCNVKFMIEGEEEIGSINLEAFCEKYKEMLKADVILVSDTGMLGAEIPSITTGLRGISYLEVAVTGPNRDLHSGLYGGAVANPAIILSQLISGLFDSENRITIPGFYDNVLEHTADERAEMARAPFDLDEYKNKLDIGETCGEAGFSTMERTGIRPALDVNGIWGGYMSEGSKTVLPSQAFAKISMRLVPDQQPDEIAKLFENYMISKAPKSVKIEVHNLHGGHAYQALTNSKEYLAAAKAYESAFGIAPVPYRSGGSIPIIATFEKVLGIKTILMGFGLDTDAIHSPNENFPLKNFYLGIETVAKFYQFYTKTE